MLLTPKARHEIIVRLARFEAPAQIAREIEAGFNLPPKSVTTQQISMMNPTLASYTGARRWVAIFDAERERWKREVESHAISHTGYRLARLQRMSEAAERSGNFPLAAQLLEQAAKDYGGVFTNVRNLNDNRTPPPIPLTGQQMREQLMDRLKALAGSLQQVETPASQQVIEHKPGGSDDV